MSSSGALRILWVTTVAGSDGPGRALSGLLSQWPQEDAVEVCALREVTQAFRAAVPTRVETMTCGMRGAMGASALARLDRHVRARRPDILHTQLSRADWIGRALGRWRGVTVMSTIQNVHSRMYRAEFSPVVATLGRTLDHITFPFASRLIAVSAGVKVDLVRSGVDASRITVIPNTFDRARVSESSARRDIRAAWGVSNDDVVVGTVALLKPQKSIHTLVEAARLALAENPHLVFVHVGDGPLESEARQWAERAALGTRFRFLGRVAEPMTLLPGFDLFALPSEWEGLPVALLEAMAAGLPAVGTHVSGIEDAIADGVTGRLVPPRDARRLADVIVEMADAPEERRRMGEAAIERLDQYDAAAVARQYREVYLEALRDRSV